MSYQIFNLEENKSEQLFADEDSKIEPKLDLYNININNNLDNTQSQEECSKINLLNGFDSDSFSLFSFNSVISMEKTLEQKVENTQKNLLYAFQNTFEKQPILNEDNQKNEEIFFIENKKQIFKIVRLTPEQIQNNEPIVYENFLEAINNNKNNNNKINNYLNTEFGNLLKKKNISNKNNGLNELTPNDYIKLVLKNSGNVYNKDIGRNVYRIFLFFDRVNKKLNEKEKENKHEIKKEKEELIPFNNINTNSIGISPEKNDLDNKNIIYINVNKNKRKRIDSTNFEQSEEKPTAENSNKENEQNFEIVINNRKDNLSKRFNSITIESFIVEINNNLVEKENKLSKNNGDFQSKIKGMNNEDFLEISFNDIFKKYVGIDLISRFSKENKGVIDLINMTPSEYIAEKDEETFFDKDIDEKIKKIKTSKCKMILYDMVKNKNLRGLIILAEFVEKNNDDNYIRIKNLEEFEKKVKSFEGYENINLELTSDENNKINERKEILKEFAKEVKRRNENKKKKEQTA